MKLKFAAASILALGLFMGQAHAEEEQAQPQEQVQQPDPGGPAVDVAAPKMPDEIIQMANDRRTSQELGDEELRQRFRAARKMAKADGLTDDIRASLQALVDSDKAELDNRAAAAQPKQEEQPKQAQEPKVEEPKAEEKVQQAEPEVAPAPVEEPKVPQGVADFINDQTPIDQLSDEDLAKRAKFARRQSQNEKLPADIREQLTAIAKDARGALAAREAAKQEAPKVEEQPVQKTEEVVPTPEEPKQKVEEPAPIVEQPVQKVEEPAPIVEQPKENAEQTTAPVPAAPVVDKADVKELDGNVGEPESEKKARAFLEDPATAESLSDDALRARLEGMRDLMAENELSAKTERALRKKLRVERDVLRERVAKVKVEEDAKAAQVAAAADAQKQKDAAAAGEPPPKVKKRKNKFNVNIIINADTPMREVLADRRDAEDMDESELRYRRRAWRDFQTSDGFRDWDRNEVEGWRERDDRDRNILRRRLEEDRNIRRIELDDDERESKPNIRRIVIEDKRAFDREDDIPEDIYAAEVSDDDIEKAILAPPRKRIQRRIAVEEIAQRPDIRKTMTRIEVDTIRFGFNEAFVREEEVDNLDQIASVIERVLKKYPREVFLIEGHTDAVGSDAYNDRLSKLRAEAVKKALSTYYIIPAKNLKTVGLGERYLKIPTAEAEGENRRVSISRATAVIGEAEE
jgi:outer membrane protein OmpA-like peptidoglycan-associated protein